MALRARFHDGETATAHLVEVTFIDDGLEIVGAGVRSFWRRQDVTVVSHSHAGWRLGVSSAPDARLVLEKSADADQQLRQAGIVNAQRDALRGSVLVGGLIAVGALLAATVFIFIPMAAEPLARMTPPFTEAQLGENVRRQVEVFMRPCTGPHVRAAEDALGPLVDRLAIAGEPAFNVRVSFVRDLTPNALALPGGHILVTQGLLQTLEDPEALAAVLAHEIGHVKARDGMVALYRNAGLGILLELVTGGSGVAQQVVLIGGQLAELRYTRAQEERADMAAIQIMRKAGHDPAALARAFEALKEFKAEDTAPDAPEKEAPRKATFLDKMRIPEWLQSHPDLDARIARARAAAAPGGAETLSPEAWGTVRNACTK